MAGTDRTIDAWDVSLIDEFCYALKRSVEGHCRGWPEDDGDVNRAEGVRQSIRLASAGVVSFLESNPAYPDLIKQQTITRQIMSPSADAVYHYSRLDGAYTYRVRGPRGSAHILQLSVWSGTCSNLRDYACVSKADSDASAFLAPGGTLDLVLSATEQDGDWMRLPPGSCELWVRQYYADWDTEQPAMLTIERQGALYPPPPPTRAEITERLRMVNDWLDTHTAYFDKSVKFHLATDPAHLPQLQIPEAFQDNAYLNGHFRCRPDQAIILEVTPPNAVYWGFQLLNLQWEQMEFHMRQTSLNFHQARTDGDGTLRIVISHQDPGVANWLDTSGRTLGLLAGRYYKADGVPIPSLTTIPFAEVSGRLPPDTPRVSPAERQRVLRGRWASAYRRLCGDQ